MKRKPPTESCKPFSTAGVSAGSAKPAPARRLRLPDRLPVPVGSVPYANRRDELKQMTPADHVLLLQATDAWQQVMVPLCQQIDAERSGRGLKFLYTSEELELFLVYGRSQGLKSIKEIRASLAGDMALRERRLLGFDRARNTRGPHARTMQRRDGVPSESTVSRHKKRVSDARRRDLWMEIERRLRTEHLQTEELQEEARVMNLDGTPLLTHYQAPMKDKHHKTAFNEGSITCPDGGYVGGHNDPGKSGHAAGTWS